MVSFCNNVPKFAHLFFWHFVLYIYRLHSFFSQQKKRNNVIKTLNKEYKMMLREQCYFWEKYLEDLWDCIFLRTLQFGFQSIILHSRKFMTKNHGSIFLIFKIHFLKKWILCVTFVSNLNRRIFFFDYNQKGDSRYYWLVYASNSLMSSFFKIEKLELSN